MPEHGQQSADDGLYRSLLLDSRLSAVVFVSVAATLGTNVVSPVLPAISSALAVSDSRIGLVISAYSFMAMVSVPFTGVLADIYGRRRVLLPSLLVYGLAGSAISLVNTFEAILLLRAVQGLSFGALMPISVTLLGDLYTGTRASAAQGIRVGAIGVGTIVVPATAGLLASVSWNYAFLMYLLTVPVAVLAYVSIPETVRGGTETTIRATVREYASAIRSEMGDVDLRVLLFGEFVRDVVRYAIYTFVPLYAVRSLGAALAIGGLLLAVRGVVFAVVGTSSGVIVAHLSRKQALVGSLLLSGGSVALLPALPTIVWVGVMVGTYTVGDALFSPVIKDTVTSLASDEQRGGVVSGMNMLKYAGSTASPAVFGVVLSLSGFASIFAIAGGFAAAYALVLLVTVSADV